MVMYQGEYVFRSMNGLLSLVVTSAFGATFIWVSSECFTMNEGQLFRFVGGVFALAALGLIAASIFSLLSILFGRRIPVVIGVSGVQHGKCFTAWDRISEFYGTSYSNGVCLAYTPANRKMYVERKMPTVPFLSVEEYQMLAESLRDTISPLYSHVRIEMTPRIPRGD